MVENWQQKTDTGTNDTAKQAGICDMGRIKFHRHDFARQLIVKNRKKSGYDSKQGRNSQNADIKNPHIHADKTKYMTALSVALFGVFANRKFFRSMKKGLMLLSARLLDISSLPTFR